jgi:hypothetical protein
MTRARTKSNILCNFEIPVDPDARAMKLVSVPRGMQLIVSVDGSPDRLEIVNPTDGRLPFFRLHEERFASERIEFNPESEDSDDLP